MNRYQPIRATVAGVLALMLAISVLNLPQLAPPAQAATGRTYYVSNTGDDAASGVTEQSAWKSLEKVNSVVFEPGDTILFDGASTWTGQLKPQGSGLRGSPITIGRYGEGDRRPLIQGNGIIPPMNAQSPAVTLDETAGTDYGYLATILLKNQQYWEISDLEVTNYSTDIQRIKTYADSDGTQVEIRERIPSKYGILVLGIDSGVNSHIYIRNTFVHDVNAFPGNDGGDSAGIGRGGIVFLIRGGQVPTWWDDIRVEQNTVGIADSNPSEPNITHYGVSFLSTWQREGKSGYGMFAHESGIPAAEMGGTLQPSTNLLIRGNSFFDVGNAVIQPAGYENAVIEHNFSAVSNSGKNGNVPIWWQFGKHTTVQFNEVFGTGASGSKEDSQAFDADLLAEHSVVRYNYTHDNPSGSMFVCPVGSNYDTDYAYNVSVNDGSGTNSFGGGSVITLACGSDSAGSRLRAYNNDIFIGEGQTGYIANAWEDRSVKNFTLENNAIYNSGASQGYESRASAILRADNNYYGGSGIAAVQHPSDLHPVTGNIGIPNLADTLKRTMAQSTGWERLNAYAREAGSVLNSAGKPIPRNGGLDIRGNEVSPFGNPSIGSQELSAPGALPQGYRSLDFSDAPQRLAGQTYHDVLFASESWSVLDQHLVLNTAAPESVRNKLVLPAGMKLVGFRAKTPGAAKLTIASGAQSEDFYLNSANNFYELAGATVARDIFVSVSAPDGAASVQLDDLVLAPQDTGPAAENVALNKPAKQNGGYNAEAAGNDGNTATTAGNSGSFPYIWSVDLGNQFNLSSIETAWPALKQDGNCSNNCAEAVKDWRYKLQWSEQQDAWNDPNSSAWHTLADYTTAGSSPFNTPENSFEQAVPVAVQARYLRIVVVDTPPARSGAWVTLGEFRAYGTPIAFTNVALNKPVQQNRGDNPAKFAVDGDGATLSGNTGSFPYIVQVDLEREYPLKRIETVWPSLSTVHGNGIEAVKDWRYAIQYASSADGWDNPNAANWNTIADYTVAGSSPFNTPENSFTQTIDTSVTARFVRIVVAGPPPGRSGAWAVLGEIRALIEGTEVQPETLLADSSNIAWGKPTQPAAAETLTDANAATVWGGAPAQIDLGLLYDLHRIGVSFGAQAGEAAIETSVDGETWAPYWVAAGEANAQTVSTQAVQARYVKVSAAVDIASITAYGQEAAHPRKTVLIVGAHPDDEAILGAGSIKRALDNGDNVFVLIATMGDYNGKAAGRSRMKESLSAMASIGLPANRVLFLGYGDDGGLEQFGQRFTDSMLYKMYVEKNPDRVFTSLAQQTATYGGVQPSFHNRTTGQEAAYTRANFLNDLQTAIHSIHPSEIFTTGTADLHPDHSYLGLFTGEAIMNIRQQDPQFNPAVFETTIHSPAGDSASAADATRWPAWNDDRTGIVPNQSPLGFDARLPLQWNERVALTVPESMRVTPFAFNRKDLALRQYKSQYYGYIGSFSKFDEVFWQRDYSAISYTANVSASSETAAEGTAPDLAADQSARRVIDGVRDGYSTAISQLGLTSNPSYPHAEWVSQHQTVGAWVQLAWDSAQTVERVALFDRPNLADQITKAHLEFSDGSTVAVDALPNNGRAATVTFEPREVTAVRLVIDEVSDTTTAVGLAEFEVFGAPVEILPDTTAPIIDALLDTRATLGQELHIPLRAEDESAPVEFSATGLPQGLAVSTAPATRAASSVATGEIAGTPTETGEFIVTVFATDSVGNQAATSFVLTVVDGSADTTPPVIASISDVSVKVGQTVRVQVAATDESEPLTYAAANLPLGLSIDAGTGVIEGKPIAAGERVITVTVTDAAGNSASESFTIFVTEIGGEDVTDAEPPTIQPLADVSITLGQQVRTQVEASDPTGPLSYAATGLPAGVTIDDQSGLVSGTPLAVGRSRVQVSVADAAGNVAQAAFVITVSAAQDGNANGDTGGTGAAGNANGDTGGTGTGGNANGTSAGGGTGAQETRGLSRTGTTASGIGSLSTEVALAVALVLLGGALGRVRGLRR